MRILVVEDEHKIANSIKKGLEQESFIVDVAYDGEAGFDMATESIYDLIILDLMLPKMGGLEVCKKLRIEEKIHTPILILTAKDQVEDKVEGLNAGADDYLAKPFAFSELIARIRALTRRPKQVVNNVLSIDSLTMDSTNFEVKRAGMKVELSKTEFTLLEFLLRNSNKILTKNQIIDHVWEYDSNVLPNTVEVYIGYLRKKIDKKFPNQKKLIHTIRGFGYKVSDT